MNKRNGSTAQHQMAKQIEDILAAERVKGDGSGMSFDTSLYGFCAHLASTVPQANPDFQQQLERRLVEEMRWRSASPAVSAAIKGDPARPASWFCRLLSRVNGFGQVLRVGKGLAPTRRTVLLAAAILTMVFTSMLIAPGVRALVGCLIREIALGVYTKAVQVAPGISGSSEPPPPDTWIVRTECSNFAGNAPPGIDPTVHSIVILQEAQAATDFHLRVSVFLPQGYALRETKLAPIGGTYWALLFCGGPGHDIVIAQMPGGPRPSDDPREMSAVISGILTDGTLDSVDLDGRPAVWADSRSLLWESESISYLVCGLDLDLEQALRIVRSLR